MEEVFCNVHSKQTCFLKTGTKDGSQKGKSFYVCSHKGDTPCSFTQKADSIQALDCPVHRGNTVELQMIHTSQSKQQKRLYYRCLKKSGAFCGFRVIEDNVGVTNVLKVKNGSSLSSQPKKKPSVPSLPHPKTPEKTKQLLDFGEIARSAGAKPRPVSKLPSSLNDSGYRHEKIDDDSDDDCFVVEAAKTKHAQQPLKPTQTLSQKVSQLSLAPQPVKVASATSVSESTAPTAQSQDAKQSADALIRQFKLSVESRSQKAKELQQKKAILSSVSLNMLPDGGRRLQSQISELTSQLAQLDVQISRDKTAVAQLPNVVIKTQPTAVKPTQPTQPVVRTVSGQILPEGARQLKLTDHYSALAAQDYQRMLAANPQMEALYGGRMTQARLRQVGQVTDEALESLHKQLDSCPTKEDEVDDPEGLVISLMLHQRQALAWLTWREAQNPAGGILADDMGLGKTLTMISFILLQRQKGDTDQKKKQQVEQSGLILSNATLVVAPASLIYQWSNEIKRRCSPRTLKVVMHHGPQRETNPHKLSKADIVLTTYDIVRREAGLSDAERKNKALYEMPATDSEGAELEKQPGLLRIAWQRVILDEAHAIKNHKSQTAVAICRLRALSRWALTGTPIQNNLLDVYSLIRFLRCSPFDEYKVWKRQVDNTSAKSQKRLQLLVKTLLLRRTKDESDSSGRKLVSLPDKTSQTHELTLSSDERKVYDKIYQQSRAFLQDYLQRQEDKEAGIETNPKVTNAWTESGNQSAGPVDGAAQSQGRKGRGQMLLLLLRLRQCCSHLSLMKAALETESLVDGDGLQLDLVEQMKDLALDDEAAEEPSATKGKAFQTSAPSSKILAVMDELRRIRANSPKGRPMKSVIVSQWTSMLDIMEQHLKTEGLRCATIKGNIKPETRAELVDQFNSDPKGFEVMLVSLRAGGVGLNLIGGNHLFIIDLHWNPALEQQAADRIYRVGQTKDVFIHRFICQETIEEKISKLQEGKMSLAKNVLAGGAATSTKLTLDDLKSLFDLHQPMQGATAYSQF